MLLFRRFTQTKDYTQYLEGIPRIRDLTKLKCAIRENVDAIGDLTDSPKFGNGSKIRKEYDIRNSRMKEVRLQNSREKGAGMPARPGPNFPDPIQSKG